MSDLPDPGEDFARLAKLYDFDTRELAAKLDELLESENDAAQAVDGAFEGMGAVDRVRRRYRGLPAKEWVVIVEFDIISEAEAAHGRSGNKARVEALSWQEALDPGHVHFERGVVTVEQDRSGQLAMRLDLPIDEHLDLAAARRFAAQMQTAAALLRYDGDHSEHDVLSKLRAEEQSLESELQERNEKARKWVLSGSSPFKGY